MDSVLDGVIDNIRIHDISATDTTLASCLLAGIVIDGNRLGSISSRIRVSNYFIKNLTQGQPSITLYNYQTSGIVVAGVVGGGGGCVELTDGRIENVAQALDLESNRVKVHNVIIFKALVCAFKLVHDVRFVEITGHIDVDTTGGPVFFVVGTNTGTVGPADIDIHGGQYSDIGLMTLTGPTTIPKAFIATDGASALQQPRRVRWHSPRIFAGSAMANVLQMGNGSAFEIDDAFISGTPSGGLCSLTAGTEVGTIFTLEPRSVVRAAQTANTTPGATTALIVCGMSSPTFQLVGFFQR
jgi:hypothetical protein